MRFVIRHEMKGHIRVHMAQLGHPLVGDCIYGDGTPALGARALLHAAKLSFVQPFTGKPITVCAPFPEDFAQYCLNNGSKSDRAENYLIQNGFRKFYSKDGITGGEKCI